MCGLLTVVPGLPQTNINTTRIRFKCMLTHLSAESEKNMQGIMYSPAGQFWKINPEDEQDLFVCLLSS